MSGVITRALHTLALLLCVLAPPAHAAMVTDGKLDEPQWQQAQRFSDFTMTVPNTQGQPSLRTEVRVFTDASGLHVGFICDQPPEIERVRSRSSRDRDVEADRVTLIVDFEGRGNTAYEFSVSISNGIRDAIIGNTLLVDANGQETRFNTDWDADFDRAVSETDTQWFVEIHLPWSIAPSGAGKDGQMQLGMFFSRVVSALGHRFSLPGSQLDRPTLLADLQPITVAHYASRQLDVFPYASASRDFHAREEDARVGVDLFWKPRPQHQLTATINPDFGQVESDALVVNFSAIPTFFPDKRPFFTENQSLFDTDAPLVYTRRIGAAPDAGMEGSSDIIGAAKYTGGSGSWDYGLISAFEDDSRDAEGRDFLVGRARNKLSSAVTVGWLGTHVERPELDRTADVQSVDVAWTLRPGATLRAQAMVSDIQRAVDDTQPDTPLDPAGSGEGAIVNAEYAPGGAWAHALTAEHYGDSFGIDDAGFLERNNIERLTTLSTYTFRSEKTPGRVRETDLSVLMQAAYNGQGERLPSYAELGFDSLAPDASTLRVQYSANNAGGVDDLVTRGNGPVRCGFRRRVR